MIDVAGEWGELRGSAGVFVIGCPRSGTSAISWAISQHPDFWTSAESDFLVYLLRNARLRIAYQTNYNREDSGWLRVNKVSYSEFAASIGIGIDRLFLSRSGGKRWIDQTPGHTLIAEELALMFPNARFIHIVRDGRAVVQSMLHSGFPEAWASAFEEACRTWSHYVRVGHEFARGHPDRCLEIRQEDLLSDAQAVMSHVFAFLGAHDWRPSSEFLRQGRINSSFEPTTLKAADAPPSGPSRIESAQNWTPELENIFADVAGPMRRMLGYEPCDAPVAGAACAPPSAEPKDQMAATDAGSAPLTGDKPFR